MVVGLFLIKRDCSAYIRLMCRALCVFIDLRLFLHQLVLVHHSEYNRVYFGLAVPLEFILVFSEYPLSQCFLCELFRL